MSNLTAEQMKQALTRLDELLDRPLTLIVGGGGALILAHGLSLATTDIDAVPKNRDLQEVDAQVKQVARDLELVPDWLNPYFSTFTHVLPPDYASRLVNVYEGKHLTALALGAEEMLLMKCFAGRKKDAAHARALLEKAKRGELNLEVVESQLEKLIETGIPGASEAMDFFDEVKDFLA